MKVTVIPVVIGKLGTIHTGLIKGVENLEIRGQVKTILTVRILRRVLETWEDFLSHKRQWKTIC